MGFFRRKQSQEGDGDRLVAVPADEVVEMLDRLRGEIEARYPGERHEAMDMALRSAVRYVVPEAEAPENELISAVSVATVGYLFRQVEEDVMDAATPADLTEALLNMRETHPEWQDWFAAVAGAAATCAVGEELSRNETLQWAIPGIGGQAREMFATSTVEGMGVPGGTLKFADYARCWRYGWYLRCFEVAMPPSASF